jgi:hypothetical protein
MADSNGFQAPAGTQLGDDNQNGQGTPGFVPPAGTSLAQDNSSQQTGVLASVKRNTVGAIEGIYHALTDPATDQEKADLLKKVQDENKRQGNESDHVPESLATNPSRATLALHRILDAPAQELSDKANKEEEVATDLLKNHKYWKGGNLYLSGLVDKGLSYVPLVGPAINKIAERAEHGDVSGAVSDALIAGAATNLRGGANATVAVATEGALSKASSLTSSAAETAAKPGILKQIVKGAEVSQEPAQAALRSGAEASATDAGVEAGQAAKGTGIRSLMEKPISKVGEVEDAAYDSVNKAAETDMKSLYDRQTELQDALEDPTNIANKKPLTEELGQVQKQIGDGEAKVQAKLGENAADAIERAKQTTQQRYAMEDLDRKIFNNESVVEGNVQHGIEESINVKQAIRQAELLDKPSKFAPRGSPTRLQQALGEKGAAQFKQGLYAAQKAGLTAIRTRAIAKIIGYGVGATVGFKTLKKAASLIP